MRNIFNFGMTLFLLLLLSSCASQMSIPQNVKREWMLIEFQNFSKGLLVQNKANLNLTATEEPKVFSAGMGCNKMFGEVNFMKNGKVIFSKIGSTMMHCNNNITLETAFGKELPKMIYYEIDGHFLTLSDGNKNTMRFVAADWD